MTRTDLTRRAARLSPSIGETVPAIPTAPRTPEGWYADPAVATQVRWWDGIGWSNHVRPAPGAELVHAVVEADADADAAPRFTDPFEPAPSSLMGVRTPAMPVPAALTWNTASIWALAFMPIWFTAGQVVFAATLFIESSSAFTSATGLISVLLMALLIVRDRAELLRRGFVKPASSFWGLLGPLGYLIARAVKMRRAIGRGSAPLWWYVGITGASILLSVGIVFAMGVAQGFTAGLENAGLENARAPTGGHSTAHIEQSAQSSLDSEGFATSVIDCPDTADLSPNATFDCAVTGTADPTLTDTIRITITPDGTSYEAVFVDLSGS